MSGAEDARQRELQRQQALLAALDSGRFSGFAPGQAPQALNVQQASPSLGLQAYRRNAQGLADRALAERNIARLKPLLPQVPAGVEANLTAAELAAVVRRTG